MSNSNFKAQAFLFAAGLGTRLRPYTEQTPKPALPLLGYSLGYYLLPYLKNLNLEKIVVNTFHLANQVQNIYEAVSPILNCPVEFSHEKDFIKGSAGGLKLAENKLNSCLPVLAANADEVLFTKHTLFLSDALAQHQNNKNYGTLIVTHHPEAGRQFGGIWTDSKTSKRIIAIGKSKPHENAYAWHFVGLQFLNLAILKNISLEKEANIFYDCIVHQLTHHNFEVFPVEMDWYETGNIHDYQEAQKHISTQLLHNLTYTNHFQEMSSYPRSQLSDLA